MKILGEIKTWDRGRAEIHRAGETLGIDTGKERRNEDREERLDFKKKMHRGGKLEGRDAFQERLRHININMKMNGRMNMSMKNGK